MQAESSMPNSQQSDKCAHASVSPHDLCVCCVRVCSSPQQRHVVCAPPNPAILGLMP